MTTLVAIVGPTAAGKSEVALQVAERMGGAIISCDSMQVYRGMDIGTAKPGEEDQKRVKHYLIDVVEPNQAFTVAQYQKMAMEAIKQVGRQGMIPFLVGGTGLYYQAVVDGYNFARHENAKLWRQRLQERRQNQGLDSLFQELKEVDPLTAARTQAQDERRIIRALEVYYVTGKPLSTQANRQGGVFPLLAYGLTRERLELYRRIDERVDLMLEQGLLKEVEGLAAQGVSMQCTSMQGIGYKELRWYLEGIVSYPEAVQLIKRESRRYAKRQLTWFKRDRRIKWFDLTNIRTTEVVEKICEDLGRTLQDSVE